MTETRFDVYTTEQIGSTAPGASGAKKVGVSSISNTRAKDVQGVLEEFNGRAGAADASDARKGIAKLSRAPTDPENPVAVGDNDPRFAVEAWREVGASGQPSLLNGWVHFGAPYNTPGFYKDRGRVYLKGFIKNGSSTAAVTAGQTVFALPAGYRPAAQEVLNTQSDSAVGRFDVTPTGEVVVIVGNNRWISLDNLSFRAA